MTAVTSITACASETLAQYHYYPAYPVAGTGCRGGDHYAMEWLELCMARVSACTSLSGSLRMSGTQLPLAIGLRDSATFDNFLVGANQASCHALQQGGDPFVYLWGASGSGKSHLLQAACHAEDEAGGRVAYLPLHEFVDYPPDLLEGMEQMSLVCVDELQCVAGHMAWQQGLFHLYNRLRDSGRRLLAAGNAAPHALGLALPDLVSRLAWGLVYRLEELDDGQKAEALRLRAGRRGMEMSAEVAAYLLAHGPRDMHRLFGLLEQIDHHSLVAQRRLTIPFVRQLLTQASQP